MKFIKGDFVVVPNKELILSYRGACLNVYLAICSFADDEGKCFPSYETLAKVTGYTTRACKDGVQELLDNGVITKEKRERPNGSQASNYYQIFVKYDDTDVVQREGGVNHSSLPSEPQFTPLTQPINSNKKINKKENEALKTLFFALVKNLGGQESTTRFTDGRRTKLKARLKAFSADDLKKSALSINASDFMRDGGYNNIDYLLRNDEKVEQWLNKYQPSAKQKAIDHIKVQDELLKKRMGES